VLDGDAVIAIDIGLEFVSTARPDTIFSHKITVAVSFLHGIYLLSPFLIISLYHNSRIEDKPYSPHHLA
jgi:hypothetical protein